MKIEKNMKIGLILNHISLRSDIRLFIEELSIKNNVVLYGRLEDYELINCQNCEFREIKPVKNLLFKFFNKILRTLYYFIGNLPYTRKEFNDYQVRIIHKIKDQNYIKKDLKRHKLRMKLPHFFSYDKYLSFLFSGNSNISDVDLFIAYTDLNNDNLISQIVQENKNLIVYVHSWDHIPKFTRFLKNKVTYLTWNEFIKDDLINIHKIDKNKIIALGASQFYFIKDFINYGDYKDTVKKKYIYFPCSFGYPKVAIQEVKIIKSLSEELFNLDNSITIIVRPYPMLKSWKIYKTLENLKNVSFDSFKQSKDLYMSQNDHMHKCKMIKGAIAVIHTGTTIGLEASYFETPVIYLNINDINYSVSEFDENHIFYSWNQYHLKKYYYLTNFTSVVKTKLELINVLKMLLSGDIDELLLYNKKLRTYSPLFNISEFTSEFVKVIKC